LVKQVDKTKGKQIETKLGFLGKYMCVHT